MILFYLYFFLGIDPRIVRQRRGSLFLRDSTLVLVCLTALLILLNILQALNFLNVVFGELVLNIDALTLLFFVHFIEHFMHF